MVPLLLWLMLIRPKGKGDFFDVGLPRMLCKSQRLKVSTPEVPTIPILFVFYYYYYYYFENGPFIHSIKEK